MATQSHGYSGKPLFQKLGLKPGMTCLVVPNGLSQHGDFSAAHAVLTHAGQIPAAIKSLQP